MVILQLTLLIIWKISKPFSTHIPQSKRFLILMVFLANKPLSFELLVVRRHKTNSGEPPIILKN